MSGIRFSKCCKNGAVLLSILLLMGCQPSPNDDQQSSATSEALASPVISADSVTMTSDYILDVKPSRYQPSLGLQGIIEPIKQARFITAHDAVVQKVLVKEGQWVEEGAPLLIVQRQSDSTEKAIVPTNGTSTDDTSASQRLVDKDKASLAVDTTGSQSQVDEEDNKAVSANTPKVSENSNETLPGEQINGAEVISPPAMSQEGGNQSTPPPQVDALPIVVRANFSGRVDGLYVQADEQVDARSPLLHLTDDQDFRFTAILPMQAESQLSIGQTVNFASEGLTEKFTGQVSKLIPNVQPDQLKVHVHVIQNEASRNTLKPGMMVTGRVDYGQIEVGTILPAKGIHDADLSVIQKPPYQSLTPLIANVWIIKQDQRLTRQPVEVIEYDPSTDQYLVAGISNDSLICLADLPIESAGKKVIVS